MELHEATVFAMDAATPVSLASPDHGPRHWHDVARIGHALALANGADLKVVFLFALLHDTQRVNEYIDPDHGNRAEDLLDIMRDRGVVKRTNAQREILGTALGDHDRGYTHADPTIGTCWDADRLTLWRVGKKTDWRFMSSEAGTSDFSTNLDMALAILTSKDMSWSEIVSLYEGSASDPARTIPA